MPSAAPFSVAPIGSLAEASAPEASAPEGGAMLGFGPISGAPIAATEEGVEGAEHTADATDANPAQTDAATATFEALQQATAAGSDANPMQVDSATGTFTAAQVATGEATDANPAQTDGATATFVAAQVATAAGTDANPMQVDSAAGTFSEAAVHTGAGTDSNPMQVDASTGTVDNDPPPDPDLSAFLVLGGVEIQVAQGAHGASVDPLAGDWMLRALGGNTHGLLTTARGPVLEKPIRTVGMSPADADTLTAHVGGLVKLWATGWSIGGGPIQVICTQPRRSWVSGTEVSLAFTVRSTGVVDLVPEGV